MARDARHATVLLRAAVRRLEAARRAVDLSACAPWLRPGLPGAAAAPLLAEAAAGLFAPPVAGPLAPPGWVLWRQGEPVTHAWALVRGRVELSEWRPLADGTWAEVGHAPAKTVECPKHPPPPPSPIFFFKK